MLLKSKGKFAHKVRYSFGGRKAMFSIVLCVNSTWGAKESGKKELCEMTSCPSKSGALESPSATVLDVPGW
jgi:hypothetical protein